MNPFGLVSGPFGESIRRLLCPAVEVLDSIVIRDERAVRTRLQTLCDEITDASRSWDADTDANPSFLLGTIHRSPFMGLIQRNLSVMTKPVVFTACERMKFPYKQGALDEADLTEQLFRLQSYLEALVPVSCFPDSPLPMAIFPNGATEQEKQRIVDAVNNLFTVVVTECSRYHPTG